MRKAALLSLLLCLLMVYPVFSSPSPIKIEDLEKNKYGLLEIYGPLKIINKN